MQTNFLGHFYLTNLLLSSRTFAPSPRVVNLSSVMHHFGSAHVTVGDWRAAIQSGNANAYADSKLAAVLFSMELNRRCPGLKSFAVNPGAVNSDIWRNIEKASPLLFKYAVQPAFRSVYLDTDQGSVTSVAACVVATLDPATSLYLQPYAFPRRSKGELSGGARSYSQTFPLFEMMGVFVGYAATLPRLPGGDGLESARSLWDAASEATTK